jgi:hypothetical protein
MELEFLWSILDLASSSGAPLYIVLPMVYKVLYAYIWPAITRHWVKDVLRMVLCRSGKLQGRQEQEDGCSRKGGGLCCCFTNAGDIDWSSWPGSFTN